MIPDKLDEDYVYYNENDCIAINMESHDCNNTEDFKKLIINESKEMVQVKIGDEIYAVDSDKIKNFVQTNGKKIDTSIQKIG